MIPHQNSDHLVAGVATGNMSLWFSAGALISPLTIRGHVDPAQGSQDLVKFLNFSEEEPNVT